MATAKKTTVKKTAPAKKTTVTKKTVAAKKTVKKKSSAQKASTKKAPQVKSFRRSKNEPSFTTFKITRQTVYWLILIMFIIFMQLWILSLQIEVSTYLEAQETALRSYAS